MKLKAIIIPFFATLFVFSKVHGSDGHDHKKEEKAKAESSQHDENEHSHSADEEKEHESESEHSKEEKSHAHEDEDEHGHGDEEENPQVGPKKGILSASEKDGIQLSPEAEKNFEIQRAKVSANGQTEIPKASIVTAGTEVNLFRYRGGFYRRIDFDFVQKNGSKMVVRSKDLKSGDEIVIAGMGFLRIAEIAAFGGAPEGHSH